MQVVRVLGSLGDQGLITDLETVEWLSVRDTVLGGGPKMCELHKVVAEGLAGCLDPWV